MQEPFVLAPRYLLDDYSPWLIGIDPSRHYWIKVNGDDKLETAIPGLTIASVEEWKKTMIEFRSLQAGENMKIERVASNCTIHCVSTNCYGIESKVADAVVWHLFDRETIESLLRSSHPDWQCAPKDIELGRRMLANSFACATFVK
jgi:hypothetical protein